MINPIYSNNLSLSYHTSVFFIISLSEAVYLRFLMECVNAIYLVLYLTQTHTHTHSWLFKFIIAICMYV